MSLRIYAYTIPGKNTARWKRRTGMDVLDGTGLIKVGQTTRRTARQRIKEQLGTAYPNLEGVDILLDELAKREDGTDFSDHDVHNALVDAGIQRPGGEWFEATLDEVRAAIAAVKTRRPVDLSRNQTFRMRPEQAGAVEMTAHYYQRHALGEVGGTTNGRAPKFLWNAKMRFGKTFTTYQLALRMGWRKVLVLTYKPAVQTAWRDDLMHHMDFSGWTFVDRTTQESKRIELADRDTPQVWFASFQDLRGRTSQGDVKAHNEAIHLVEWDAIVIDEYHFGAWREASKDLYDPEDRALADAETPLEELTDDDLGLTARHYLYLSGTPFRAITNGEFTEDQIFNWTYVDEQQAKDAWDSSDRPNPYLALPRMKMYAYRIGEKVGSFLEENEYAFSLNEYFKARRVTGKRLTEPGGCVFDDVSRVREFLEFLRGKLTDDIRLLVQAAGRRAPFPYESPDFADAVRHAVWYMPDVASCHAMRDALSAHPYFHDFQVVVAAGSTAGQGADAKPPVEQAIAAAERTGTGSITLTCGKLMTGVTVPEWGAIFMLRSLKSPESYFQAAFRVQSPWAEQQADGSLKVRKEPCYLFEFDPNRALSLVAEYGTRLGGTSDSRPRDVLEPLIEHLPIFAFDNGTMAQLDVDNLLDWASAGIGASALATRWNSPYLVNVNIRTLEAVLSNQELMEKLAQIEDFRALVKNGPQVVTSTKGLKKKKRDRGGKLDKPDRKKQRELNKQKREIREKLQKFLAKIPVFMYITDYREEALKDVIESLDSALFERVTGLTVEDFKQLNDLNLFNPRHMNMAIYQFKVFEQKSLEYANIDPASEDEKRIGLWDTSIEQTNDL